MGMELGVRRWNWRLGDGNNMYGDGSDGYGLLVD